MGQLKSRRGQEAAYAPRMPIGTTHVPACELCPFVTRTAKLHEDGNYLPWSFSYKPRFYDLAYADDTELIATTAERANAEERTTQILQATEEMGQRMAFLEQAIGADKAQKSLRCENLTSRQEVARGRPKNKFCDARFPMDLPPNWFYTSLCSVHPCWRMVRGERFYIVKLMLHTNVAGKAEKCVLRASQTCGPVLVLCYLPPQQFKHVCPEKLKTW